MASTDLARLETFQKYIEDMRNLSLCKICIKPFYEPFILGCGHTYCYSCLANWFGGAPARRKKMNCPDCRTEVKAEPSPNYLLRDLVHMIINRVELLPEDETVQEHEQAKDEEAMLLASDRAGNGLFKGAFRTDMWSVFRRGIMDHEDNVLRCPQCNWEMEEGECLQCGFHDYEPGDSEGDSEGDEGGLDSELEFERGAVERTIARLVRRPGHSPRSTYPQAHTSHGDDGWGGYADGVDTDFDDYDDEDEDEDEDEEMDGFIEDSDGLDDDDDDASSESTMTGQARANQATAAISYVPLRPFGLEPYLADFHAHSDMSTPENGDQSEVTTNYDETEASEEEDLHIPVQRHRLRDLRVVLSDDDDDDDEDQQDDGEQGEGMGGVATDASEEDDEDEEEAAPQAGVEPVELSATENEEEGSGSDSDVRPPQPSARRRQHLQSQRARRDYPRHQSHTQRQSRHGSTPVLNPSTQQNHPLQRSSTSQPRRRERHSGSHRQHTFDRTFGHQIPIGGGSDWEARLL